MPDVPIGPLPAWTFPVPFGADELLSSWLCRSAHLHGAESYSFLSLRFPGIRVLDRDIDVSAAPVLLVEIDRSAGLAPGSAAAASLSPVVSILGPIGMHTGSAVAAHVPFVLSASVYHRQRRLHGLAYCPECIRCQGARFQRWGRLAFVVACPLHGSPMSDGCPACDAPVIFHRAVIGRMAHCHACGVDLGSRCRPTTLDVFEAAAPIQALCMAALSAPDSSAAGLPSVGRHFLSALRSLVSVAASIERGAHRQPPLMCVGGRHAPDARGAALRGRRQIERMRVSDRATLLAAVAPWLDDWPSGFLSLASEAGVTRRSFCRLAMPPFLATAVSRLPTGGSRRRPGWRSLLDDQTMRRLRREDPAQWRASRARRLLGAAVPGAAAA